MSEWGDVRDVALEVLDSLRECGESGAWVVLRGPVLLRDDVATTLIADAAVQRKFRVTVEELHA